MFLCLNCTFNHSLSIYESWTIYMAPNFSVNLNISTTIINITVYYAINDSHLVSIT